MTSLTVSQFVFGIAVLISAAIAYLFKFKRLICRLSGVAQDIDEPTGHCGVTDDSTVLLLLFHDVRLLFFVQIINVMASSIHDRWREGGVVQVSIEGPYRLLLVLGWVRRVSVDDVGLSAPRALEPEYSYAPIVRIEWLYFHGAGTRIL